MLYDTQHIKSHLFGQYLAYGIKVTVGIILPSIIFAWADDLQSGLIVSLGAFYVSIADHPGPVAHRRNGMLVTNLFILIVGLLSNISNQIPWFLAVEIPVFCFIFGMLMIYGARASAAGMAALLMMVSSIYLVDSSIHFIANAFLSLAGGAWYMVLSLSLNQIRPYRQAQQDLGESILEVSDYLKLKAGFFEDIITDDNLYQKLIIKQIKINNHQDDVRQNVFRTRRKVNETMKSGRIIIMIFSDTVALFEQAMSIQHEFKEIRKKYAQYQVLSMYSDIIKKISVEMDDLGYALINNEKPRHLQNLEKDLEKIKSRLDEVEAQGESVLALKKTLINVRNITRHLEHMYNYFQAEQLTFLSKTEEVDLTKFISHQSFDWRLFKNNISLRSTAFRHSIRLAIGCLVGYLIALLLPNIGHSHWILITILVILKPDYSLTWQRNYERIIGTLIGGLAGALILFFIPNEGVKLSFLVIFMILAFSFNRTRYSVSVLFMTALVLILLSFIYQSSSLYLTTERIMYTVIGSVIAFSTSYFVLPTWESVHIKTYLSDSLKANLTYLQQIMAILDQKTYSTTSFQLARKELYMQTAHLSAALQRMLHEPKSKQVKATYINEFVVLSHILSSYLASFSGSLEDVRIQKLITVDHIKLVRKTKLHLEQAIAFINKEDFVIDFIFPDLMEKAQNKDSDTIYIQKQLELIEKVSSDIEKLSKTIGAA